MSIEFLSGDAAVNAASDSDFSGFTNPRAFRIGEASADRARTMLAEAFQSKWGADVRLAEAFATSDFKLAASAELDKEMQAQYDELPTVWNQYTDRTTVRDFRPKRLLSRWRNTVGFARVPELTEYPAQDVRGASEYAIAVAKYGRRFAISWEAWKNNEAIGELEDLPGELARQARETETIAALSNLLTIDPLTGLAPTGVNTSFFKAANNNAPTALPLNRANLQAVLDGMAVKKDPQSGRSIARPDVVVVIPKALEATMLGIVRPTEIRTTTAGVETIETNPLAGVSYVVEPMLDFINGNAKAATTWFVLPKPGGPRPAVWTAFLAGYETPDLRVRADTGQRVGGGDISALEGSFEVDDIQYRGRHIVGNQQADPLFTYVSLGS